VPAIFGLDSFADTLTVGLQWAVSVYVTHTSFIGSGAKPPCIQHTRGEEL
jgi:hypothetical protein